MGCRWPFSMHGWGIQVGSGPAGFPWDGGRQVGWLHHPGSSRHGSRTSAGGGTGTGKRRQLMCIRTHTPSAATRVDTWAHATYAGPVRMGQAAVPVSTWGASMHGTLWAPPHAGSGCALHGVVYPYTRFLLTVPSSKCPRYANQEITMHGGEW